MIAYHILCHGNFDQVALQIAALYDPADTFLIDVDDGQAPDTRPVDRWLKKKNVHLVRDSNIGWGGGGTLRKTIRGAFALLDLDARWDYYIVLSGQDLPLKPRAAIRARLRSGLEHGRSFMRSARCEILDPAEMPTLNPNGERCTLWGDRGHTKIYACPDTINPQSHMAARWLVDITEVGQKSEVYIDTADTLLLERRRSFFERHPFHIGANWFNLHRSLIEHMRSDPFAYELYDILRTTFIPDESYFQTYVMNSPFHDRVVNDHTRLILRPGVKAGVKVFDMGDLDRIRAGDELFGRKFDMRKDRQIFDEVLRLAA